MTRPSKERIEEIRKAGEIHRKYNYGEPLTEEERQLERDLAPLDTRKIVFDYVDALEAENKRLLEQTLHEGNRVANYYCDRNIELILENEKLRERLTKLREAILWSGSNDWTPPDVESWKKIIKVVRDDEMEGK